MTYHTGFPYTPVVNTGLQGRSANNFINPIRPTAYFGGAGNGTSNSTFLSPGGNFPGGGARYFSTTVVGNPPLLSQNPPGVGRNSFRGPKYFDVDLTLGKRFTLPNVLRLGESTGLDLRVNLFNVFNRLNLANFGFASPSTIITDARFGQATSGLAGRVIELQARFSF